MYLHIGSETIVSEQNLIGIFDLENTSISRSTREFLRIRQQNGAVVTVADDIPKSFVVSAPPVRKTAASPASAPTSAAGRSVRLPPKRRTLIIMLTAVKRRSVQRFGIIVRSTIKSVVKTRFLATSETGFMPPPASAMRRLESFAAAAKTPTNTSSLAAQCRGRRSFMNFCEGVDADPRGTPARAPPRIRLEDSERGLRPRSNARRASFGRVPRDPRLPSTDARPSDVPLRGRPASRGDERNAPDGPRRASAAA